MNLRTAPIILFSLALLLLSGCDVLSKNIATSGPARYKAEASAIMTQLKDELAKNGKVSPASKKKFEALITKYESEFKTMTSMVKMSQARDELNQMETDPNNAFQHKENVVLAIQEALRSLETEVTGAS